MEHLHLVVVLLIRCNPTENQWQHLRQYIFLEMEFEINGLTSNHLIKHQRYQIIVEPEGWMGLQSVDLTGCDDEQLVDIQTIYLSQNLEVHSSQLPKPRTGGGAFALLYLLNSTIEYVGIRIAFLCLVANFQRVAILID